MHRTAVVVALGSALGMVLSVLVGVGPAHAVAISNLVPPSVSGTPRVGAEVVAEPGEWDPTEVSVTYQWLLDGSDISGADDVAYTPRLTDLGHQLSVRVTASADGFDDTPMTSAAVEVLRGRFESTARPQVQGVRRYPRTLTATRGSWSPRPATVRYQWLRGGAMIKGATGRRHSIGVADVGKRLSVRVTVWRKGYLRSRAVSARTHRIGHRVPARHTVTYHVETRGNLTASVKAFARQAQQTFDDPRGWRGSGIRFRRVESGGDFTLVLAEASRVPGFSSGCSAEWSCRVGRFVVINQTRWLHASPMWNAQGLSVRSYRHMVVNHETGHWLGHGHRTCPRGGVPAPVMQQQSKGLQGCRPNPWPTASERRTPRFG